ncbi:MAG: hypothetical protein J6B97_06655 [Bacteroidales bacterium]|nr:hypothetical protein [Bacteroidales bacterium]
MREYQIYTDVMYLMTGYLICDTDEPRYPQFDVFINENILFHTLEEAERKIAELAQDEELIDERACFFVYEVPVGANCYPAEGQKIRSYTPDGELNAESKVSTLEDCNGNLEFFHGRDENECRFAVGDKVAVFWGDHFSFETIYSLPVDSSFVEARLKDKSFAFLSDYTDDSFVTIPNGGDYYDHHNHPAIVNVFPIEELI